MNYLEEYTKIFEGGGFFRNGVPVTVKEIRPFDGGGFQCVMQTFLEELAHRESVTVLDYGCGDATHWHRRVLAKQSLPEIMGLKLSGFYRYDPCYSRFSKKPEGKFDFIICSDVLEHIPEEEVPAFLRGINSYAKADSVIFYSISTQLSHNVFADGTNMHITLKSPEWWLQTIEDNAVCKNLSIFDHSGGAKWFPRNTGISPYPFSE